MAKKIDVDALVADGKLILTLNEKVYELEDIALPVFLKAAKMGDKEDPESLHKQLATFLGVDRKDLGDLGMKKCTAAIRGITDWVLDLEGKSAKEAGKGNP